jgi:Uma2 family endonuclease
MTTTRISPLLDLTDYPSSDGEPMTESDPTRDYLIYAVEALSIYFGSRRNVYVSGNLFIYYIEGDTQASVSPDVFVVFGVSKRQRKSYKIWQEGGKAPNFILEITSKSTKQKDQEVKPKLYAQLGVEEYFQYDPTGDYLQPQLQGSRLVNSVYEPIPVTDKVDGRSMYSEVLGLELRVQASPLQLLVGDDFNPRNLRKQLRFYDIKTGAKLLSHKESEQAREQAEQEIKEIEQSLSLSEQAREQAELERQQAQQSLEQLEQARKDSVSRLLALGLAPEQIAEALGITLQAVLDAIET